MTDYTDIIRRSDIFTGIIGLILLSGYVGLMIVETVK